ncbi:TonB-dependent receptor [Sphingomonas oleivorans]|uniref:TonB-dependent receptor n=1 Tax=Sphingomonas oleivorans TaxID=1735121 RepID=A0A2T5FUN9_9SPHN|nr:TonB-dependent receptor [Sphingomonas oleivorans]PTQ08226.1 TonB-dependent receptor [Sphingomonas oleivorans]
MKIRQFCQLTAGSALALIFAAMPQMAVAQGIADAGSASPQPDEAVGNEGIVVTGSRIPRTGLTSTSPVATTTRDQIKLDRAQTIEDFSVKLPQLAGGNNNSFAGSDAFGAQTLDLRNLGQNRTLVLINGTRATPFSFRNAVDVNAIPASLIKQVDILTGGAAAVYGADAVAGVVNFILNDEYDGLEMSGSYKAANGGGSSFGGSLTVGGRIGDRGHVVGYLDYTQRNILRAGERDFALLRGAQVPPAGGNFTDVSSGRTFSFDEGGNFTLTPQTSNFTAQYPLIQPLKRYNASLFFKYDLLDQVELYGRGMFSNVRTTGSSRSGSQPVFVNEVVGINENNPFLTAQIRDRLTFVNGVAQVRVNRSLAELGIITADTERDSYQGQVGLRGEITPAIRWDTYGQYGRVSEKTTIHGDGIRNDASGKSRFAALVNSVDIFGPGATGLDALETQIQSNNRIREQIVGAATISGDTSDVFALPAGPVGFALGYEYRKENGRITNDAALTLGLSYRQGTETPLDASFDTNEFYGELLVPVIHDTFLVKKLTLEAAYRTSDYSNAGSYDTYKFGANWIVNDSLRFRGTRQTVIRAPNLGEFAGATASIPFSSLVTVPRLAPRYAGDPCVLGTGDAEQCARFGAPPPGSYDSRSAANLRGNYYFGGNPDIRPEKGKTFTIGTVFTPDFIPRLSLTVDYYDINLRDAVGQIQPVDALTSCYISNPTADNPLCAAVSRDPATGFIRDGFPIDRNLARIKQRGFDIGLTYSHDMPFGLPGTGLTWSYQGAIVTHYTIQRNEVLPVVSCKGRYGFACSSDAVSLVAPDYRHRASATWNFEDFLVQFGWQRIGEVKDSALGSNATIKAQNYFDLNASIRPIDKVTVNVGIDNVFKKKPPLPTNYGPFNTYPDTYNVIGRTFGISLTVRQ